MSEATDYILNTHAKLTFAIDKLRSMGQHAHAELFEAARTGRILALFAWRTSQIPLGMLKRASKPTLAVIGDDDYQSTGPAGWPKAAALVRWSHRVVIHGSGAEVRDYRVIAKATTEVRRLLLIETSSDQIEAWRALAGHKAALIITPASGAHPLPMTRH